MNDLSPETHATLDAELANLSDCSVDSKGGFILCSVIMGCLESYADVWPIDAKKGTPTACNEFLASRKDIFDLLCTAHAKGSYVEIRKRRKCHLMSIQLL